jgi:hypothetical protein
METIGVSCCGDGGAILTKLDGMAGRRFALIKSGGNYVRIEIHVIWFDGGR